MVLDIREQGPDLSFLDKLDKRTAHRLGVVDRVVLLDNTGSLVGNHDRYQRLVSLSHVRAVVCVAVGPIDVDGEVVLRQSSALGTTGVTLWVGDEWGSRWAGGTDRPHPITEDPPNLPDLTAALRSPQVFDRVVAVVRQVPHQTVCPGLAVVRPTVSADELRHLRAAALDDLVDHDTAVHPWPLPPVPARADAPVDPARDLISPDSRLWQGRAAVRRAVRSTLDAAAGAPGFQGLLSGRPRVAPAALGQAFSAHLADLDELLDGLERAATGTGGGRLDRLGVPPADPPRHPELAEDLRALVRVELRAGRSLRGLATHLRRLSNQEESSGSARAELAGLRATLEHRLRAPAPPPLWPGPLAVVSALAALTTAATVWLAGSALAGAGVGLLWTVLVALLAWRLPGRSSLTPEHLLAVGAAPLAALAGALVGSLLPAADVPTAGATLVTGAALAIAVATVLALWRHVVTTWVKGLRLDEAGQIAGRIESIVDERVREHVRTLTHRRRLVDAALLLASGSAELARLYGERAAADRAGGSVVPRGPVPELAAVLRGDLVELVVRSLERYLTAIGADSPLATESQALVAEAARDLRDYDEHLDARGIHSPPPMVTDNPARDLLRLALWQRSDDARRVLRSDGREELAQLCQIGDIRALNVAWRDVTVLRFAPAAVQRIVLGDTASADIITTETDMIGVLRLVPMSAGRVAHEHPTHTDGGVGAHD